MNDRILGLSPANLTSLRRLQKRLLKQQTFIQESFKKVRQRPLHPSHEFLAAVYQCSKGRPQHLVKYLRSNRPIAAEDREHLAQLFEGVLDRKPKRGRPRVRAMHSAAIEALYFYKFWRAENRRLGIRDHGQGDAMKDEAARFVVKELHRVNLNPDSVRTLMERPVHRRN